MEAESALYWRTVCEHLKSEAQVSQKGTYSRFSYLLLIFFITVWWLNQCCQIEEIAALYGYCLVDFDLNSIFNSLLVCILVFLLYFRLTFYVPKEKETYFHHYFNNALRMILLAYQCICHW